MNLEFDALLCNGIWTLVPPTSDINIVGYKWVFCLKHKADGSIDRHKTRFVAKGFHKPTTIRLVLSLATSGG